MPYFNNVSFKDIEKVKGQKAFAMALSFFLENQFKEFSRAETFRMLESAVEKWKKNPECYSKEMSNNLRIYLLMKNLEK